MHYNQTSIDNLAKAAEGIFNRPQEVAEAEISILDEETIEMIESVLNEEETELTEEDMKDLLKKAGISFLKKGGKLALKIAKGTGRLAKKALKKSTILMLKALLKKAEGIKTSPKEYDSFVQNMDQAGYMPAIDTIAQRDSLYKGAYRGSRNPFDKGTLAFQMYNDLGEGFETEEETLSEAAEHTFKVTAPNSKVYVIDGEENPTLELERGKSYVFELDAAGHPFMIKNEKTGGEGDQYNDGVTNNGAEEGKIEIRVSADTPDELYYICSYHPLMCGILKIKG